MSENNDITTVTTETAPTPAADKSYKVVLKDFEGPLDLLLSMVKERKINIEDFFLSDITEQYLSYMDQTEELDMEQAADFIEVAASLIEIKSRALLPVEKTDEEENAEDDPKTVFINRLEEYKLYKEAAEKMRDREIVNMLYRAPDDSVGQPRLVLKDMTTKGLVDALRKMFAKMMSPKNAIVIRKIEREPYTVADRMEYIKKRITFDKRVTFDELFDEDFTLDQIVTTFMALLELLNKQFVSVEQKEMFDTITIIGKNIENNAIENNG